MFLSSSFGMVAPVGLPCPEHRVEDVDAAAGERDQGLVVAFCPRPACGRRSGCWPDG
jgi:hypothetical protein